MSERSQPTKHDRQDGWVPVQAWPGCLCNWHSGSGGTCFDPGCPLKGPRGSNPNSCPRSQTCRLGDRNWPTLGHSRLVSLTLTLSQPWREFKSLEPFVAVSRMIACRMVIEPLIVAKGVRSCVVFLVEVGCGFEIKSSLEMLVCVPPPISGKPVSIESFSSGRF